MKTDTKTLVEELNAMPASYAQATVRLAADRLEELERNLAAAHELNRVINAKAEEIVKQSLTEKTLREAQQKMIETVWQTHERQFAGQQEIIDKSEQEKSELNNKIKELESTLQTYNNVLDKCLEKRRYNGMGHIETLEQILGQNDRWSRENEELCRKNYDLKKQIHDFLFWFNKNGSPCDGFRFRQEVEKLAKIFNYNEN